MNKTARVWLLVPVLLMGSAAVQAGGVRLYAPGEIPESGDVAEILGRGAAQAERPKMRGISLEPVYQRPDAVHQSLQRLAEPEPSVVGLPVRFAFDSAEILPENKPQLDALAEGIRLANVASVVVEGHTDAHGPEHYNLNLSRQRAEAVKQYLVHHHGISASRLVIEGRGQHAPINPADPFAAENRRVQFRAAN
jgi:outer membrane protein OmpA-like peptidoglycan-associated protein